MIYDNKDDMLTFADENKPAAFVGMHQKWRILIVDDEEDVHKISKLVLSDLFFSGKSVEIISCYSRIEAEKILREEPNIAIILLDVVMEEEDAGLRLVKFIRDELHNNLVRIILRTGQPGQAPEAKVIIQYDINDYKSKTELTAGKLITAVIASLRAYRDIITIDNSRKGLEKIIDASANIFEIQSMKTFVTGILLQLVSILRLNDNALYCRASGITATSNNGELTVMAATGKYDSSIVYKKAKDAVDPSVYQLLWQSLTERRSIFNGNTYVAYFRSKNGIENIVYLERDETMHDWEKDLIDIFCSNVAIAYENIYLNQELENSQKEIIITLGEVIDSRSRETQNHVKRVGEYCKYIGSMYGLDENDIETLRVASALHDIGKIAIPDSLLQKPGKLDDDEMTAMKKHSMYGGEMLRFSTRNILRPAGLIAFQHHERYDGKGYPLGLAGEEIHIFSRITTAADVFDALTTDRVYRKALPFQQVIDYFKSESGTQFDSKIAKIIVDNAEDMKLIMENNLKVYPSKIEQH
jgi:response regulator RpfG family c-di-GMP phosphodiesterase